MKPREMLKDLGAVLVRTKKHDVYRLPNGQMVTLAHSASDHRAEKNQIRDIRRAMRNGELCNTQNC